MVLSEEQTNMSETDRVQEAIELYFDCMYESSEEKVRKVFHPSAKITGFMQGKLLEQSVDQFAAFVVAQEPSPKEKGDEILLETLSMDITGETAVARVRDGYIGMVFVDTLSFLKVDGQWVIYNKLFHVES
tara:strand:+ start:1674 stop:2066 length:393 start_codon:yes stop_codon:yes gene_type:complete